MVSVKMYATVREAFGSDEALVDASNLAELFEILVERGGPALGAMLHPHSMVEGGIIVLVNGRNVITSDYVSVRLSGGDEVAIFPPVSGG